MITKFIMNTGWLLLMIVLSAFIYIRMAPHDLTRVHVTPPVGAKPAAPLIGQGSALFLENLNTPTDKIWPQLVEIILSSPRTTQIAGSQKEGMMTFVSRSLVFGFPDYTTVLVAKNGQGSSVSLFGRLRFGRSDFGVNAERVGGWVQAIKALDQPR